MDIIFIAAQPNEIKHLDPEPTISGLPEYNLPLPRQKTDLEDFEPREIQHVPKIKQQSDVSAAEWEKLKPKEKPAADEKMPMVLGKGGKPGNLHSSNMKPPQTPTLQL